MIRREVERMKNKSVELNVKVDRTEIDEAIKKVTELKAKLDSLPTRGNVVKKVSFNKSIAEIVSCFLLDLKSLAKTGNPYGTDPQVKLQAAKDLADVIYTLEKTRALYDVSNEKE